MKILYVTTISNTLDFFPRHIEYLVSNENLVDVACNIIKPVNNRIRELGCNIHNIPFQRTPFSVDNYKAYRLLKKLIEEESYDIVHTHTPVASAIVRLACMKINTRVIYTAHGFHFHKGSSVLNWLLYYPVEKMLSRFTDSLITINNEDFARASNSFDAKNVRLIHGVGIDAKNNSKLVVDIEKKRKELGIPRDAKLFISVGELNINKNHRVVINAVSRISNENIHYVICGVGSEKSNLLKLAQNLGVSEKVHLLGYRNDILEIMKASDALIHPSSREGLPVSIMEALSVGLPVIASKIRGNADLIQDNINGWLVDNNNIDEFVYRITDIVNGGSFDKNKIYHSVTKFDFSEIIPHIYDVYNSY